MSLTYVKKMGSMVRRDDGQEAECEDSKILQMGRKFSNAINSFLVKLGAGASNTRTLSSS